MSEPVSKPIHINESEYGENQWRNGGFLIKDGKRYAAGQSAVFHRAQQNKHINIGFLSVKIKSGLSNCEIK
jgi:hypothetical protein